MAKVVVVEDDTTLRTVLKGALNLDGHSVYVCDCAATAAAKAERGECDVVVSDVMLSAGPAWDDFVNLRLRFPKIPLIVISARSNLMTALEVKRIDATAFFPKPFDINELTAVVNESVQGKRVHEAGAARGIKAMHPRPISGVASAIAERLVGSCPAMQGVYRSIAKCAVQAKPIVLVGEKGTGKRLTAKVLAQLRQLGERAQPQTLSTHSPMVEVGESGFDWKSLGTSNSNGTRGTLYVPEVQNLDNGDQLELLRVLRNESLLVVVATSGSLYEASRAGRLRGDLFVALGRQKIELPPLRERLDDLSELLRHAQRCDSKKGNHWSASDSVLPVLEQYSWPGNVRQLRQVLHFGVQAARKNRGSTVLEVADIQDALFRELGAAVDTGDLRSVSPAESHQSTKVSIDKLLSTGNAGVYREAMANFEAELLGAALRRSGGNRSSAAKLLGLHRNTMNNRLKALAQQITDTDKTTKSPN